MKRIQLKVTLSEDEAAIVQSKLKEKGYESLTQLVRKMFNIPAKNPRPCAEYHADKQQGPL